MTAPAAGVLLAAGAGSRLGRPKALARLGGELLVDRGARILIEAGCAPVVVVLGAAADEVRAEARLAGVDVVDNPRWATGIASSLQAGLAALGGRVAAAVVALADQPLVTPEVVRRLVAAWREGAVAAVAAYDGEARNPVLFDASVWSEVAGAVAGDEGARAWLQANPDRVTVVECSGLGSPADIDTGGDLAALRRTLGGG